MSEENKQISQGKKLTGVVVSRSDEKTIKVVVRDLRRHPVYKKTLKLRKFYLVHDHDGKVEVGQTVEIQSCKPFSKRKSWVLGAEISA